MRRAPVSSFSGALFSARYALSGARRLRVQDPKSSLRAQPPRHGEDAASCRLLLRSVHQTESFAHLPPGSPMESGGCRSENVLTPDAAIRLSWPFTQRRRSLPAVTPARRRGSSGASSALRPPQRKRFALARKKGLCFLPRSRRRVFRSDMTPIFRTTFDATLC